MARVRVRVGVRVGVRVEVGVRARARVSVTLPDDRRLLGRVAVEAVDRDVEVTVGEPRHLVRGLGVGVG